ncbi:hypothetical protein J6590_088622 [Homalodisca vitripennis]|nr:hypothetical protein J6590_088622 [Homalodisca vitripennis]
MIYISVILHPVRDLGLLTALTVYVRGDPVLSKCIMNIRAGMFSTTRLKRGTTSKFNTDVPYNNTDLLLPRACCHKLDTFITVQNSSKAPVGTT